MKHDGGLPPTDGFEEIWSSKFGTYIANFEVYLKCRPIFGPV